MVSVTRKTEVGPVDGTPLKRMFWSIVSDYDLKTSLCELVDNALDLWVSSKERKPLEVRINLDVGRQLISVTDNAGGVKEAELRVLVAPGGMYRQCIHPTIREFGVLLCHQR